MINANVIQNEIGFLNCGVDLAAAVSADRLVGLEVLRILKIPADLIVAADLKGFDSVKIPRNLVFIPADACDVELVEKLVIEELNFAVAILFVFAGLVIFDMQNVCKAVAAECKIFHDVDFTLSRPSQPDSFTADGKVKIGYVGAYNYAEVVSGYTAFFLGVQSVYPDVQMEVMYTNSWFDIDKEGAAAEALIAYGAVIIGQHADSTVSPAASQKL